ncbi:thioredoxin family protein [Candidatus Mycoplasma haematohominis]|uniref:Thioredoxin n=1 Tax=Candidatus Mycoplasma haematohominis TaxID=1494318 RepID=A0A478FQ97_9MOLU|nr:thioredoxin family protein [Candidatus Mycoplasma haemohominis]GCE63641.1 thioredoxin [Candidatus Mycoplasma haemohominis]
MALVLINTLQEAKDHIFNDQNVLLMASATFCPPCKLLTPVIESIANDFKDRNIVFLKVNLDDVRDVNDLLSVGSVPTLIFFKDGQELHRSIGFSDRESIVSRLKQFFPGE